MRAAGFQFEAQAEFVGGEAAGGQACGQSVDQPGQQEGQRLQQFHGIFQFDLVFETEYLRQRKQLAIAFAARQFAQAQSLRSEPFRDAERRQRRHFLEAPDPPALKSFQ